MAAARCSAAASGMLTRALLPLNDSAAPNRPAAVQVALAIEPLLPNPDMSPTAVPAASLNPNARTKPPGDALDTVTVTALEVVALPPVSRARAVRTWVPF